MRMICIIALIVFGFLGIFSAKYRVIAKEAFECVFKRITLRKCDTGLDKRLKAQITGKLMKKHQGFGKWMYKNFEILSWIFLILLLISIFYFGQGVYYFAKYGNCNGPNNNSFCIFDPLNTFGNEGNPDICTDPSLVIDKELSFKGDLTKHPTLGSQNASVTIVEYGCFSCPNTALAEPIIRKLAEEYKDEIYYVYIDFPIKNHAYAYEASLAAECIWQNQPEYYWDYRSFLFDNQKKLSEELLLSGAQEVGADKQALILCLDNEVSKEHVDNDFQSGIDSGVYGTPTFFINDDSLVGAVSYKELKKVIKDNLES